MHLTDMDAHAPKSVFQDDSCILKVGVGRHAHHHVEVRRHELFAFTGYYVLYLLDVPLRPFGYSDWGCLRTGSFCRVMPVHASDWAGK